MVKYGLDVCYRLIVYKIKMKSTCNYQIFMLLISECAFFHSIPGENYLSYTKKFMQKKSLFIGFKMTQNTQKNSIKNDKKNFVMKFNIYI